MNEEEELWNISSLFFRTFGHFAKEVIFRIGNWKYIVLKGRKPISIGRNESLVLKEFHELFEHGALFVLTVRHNETSDERQTALVY
jgi:hypothetical protein